MQAGTFFFSCHLYNEVRHVLLSYCSSNKLTLRPLKFQRVTANNSLDFVQFLKKYSPTPRPNFGSLYAFRNLFFFFTKIALDTCIET
jgi:hypothetical protein